MSDRIDNIMSLAFYEGFEFWKPSTETEFREAAERLVQSGWDDEEIAGHLGGLYAAVADCYGD